MDPEAARAKNRHVGRKATKRHTSSTEPGKVFFLSLLSTVPVLYLFVIARILRPDVVPIEAFPTWRALFLVGTPALAAAALHRYYRAPTWTREHNAAKAGRMLALANGALWLLYGGLYVVFLVAGTPPGA